MGYPMFGRHFFEFGEFGRRARMFEQGDFKYILLDLLKDKPSHGYEIIRALEERFHGFYVPSAGIVYPTLQLFEDMGYVSLTERDGKKVYTITDEGRKFLEDHEEVIGKIKDQMKSWWGPTGRDEIREELYETWHELRHLGRTFGRRARQIDSEKLARIKEVVSRARRDIEAILDQESSAGPTGGEEPGS